MNFYQGKKILLIGGTGTIGQGILSYILKENPEVVRVFSRDEHKQFELHETLQGYRNIRFLIGDIRDCQRLERAMQGIDFVFHTAAMKHVPACEYNPYEAVKTNIVGTQNVIKAALDTRVKKVIFTSTDKAIAPTNTYGASKLMAERLIASAQYNSGKHETIFAAVRFGNVMGSRGSVIPLFKKQIIEKGKITVTDLKMSRFMMTQQQAVELTIKAMKIAQGGEVFVLKMPVVNLKDLAEVITTEMARKLHISKDDIGIQEIGIRPGEKMYEELMTVDEAKDAYELPDMFVIPNMFLNRKFCYMGATKAEIKSYGSDDVAPVTQATLLDILKTNQLV